MMLFQGFVLLRIIPAASRKMKLQKLIKSDNSKTRVFFNTTFIIIETVFDKGLFFIINVLLARYFTPELFGEYTTALGYATLFSTFCDIGIKGTLVRSIAKDPESGSEHVTSALVMKTLLVFLSYSALAISLFFVNYNADVICLILILGIFRIGDEYRKVILAIVNAHEKFLWSSVFNTLFALSFLSVTIAVILLKGNYFHISWSRSVMAIILVAALAVIVLRGVKLRFSYQKFKEFLPHMFYFGFGTLFSNAYKRFNIVLISIMCGSLYAGYFNNAFVFFLSLFFIPDNISRVLMPHLLKESIVDNKKKFQFTYEFYSRFYAVISFYICIILFLFANDIITFFYGEKYLPAVPVLQILAFGIPPLFNINNLMLTLIDKQKQAAVFQAVAFLVNVVTTIILVYFMQIKGAAIAIILTYFSLNIMSGFYLVRNDFVNFRNIRIVLFKILFISIITCLFYFFLFNRFNFMAEFLMVSAVYALLILIIIVNRDDIRILKEILGRE